MLRSRSSAWSQRPSRPANRFNDALRRLKEKLYIKGPFAIKQHFQALDSDVSGVLEREEFVDALKQFNLGDCVTPDVAVGPGQVIGYNLTLETRV